MAKDPAFLLYSSDFLTGTLFMTNEEIGIYIKLLCVQHQHNGRINEYDFDKLVANNERIRMKFKKDADGYYNERLLFEINKRSRDSNASRSNGLKGGRPLKKPKHNLNITQEKPKHNLTENEDIIIYNNINNNIKEKIKNKKENENQEVSNVDVTKQYIINDLNTKSRELFEAMTTSELWMSATCKGLSLPFNQERNYQWVKSKLYMFMNQRISEGAIAVSERELKRHFLNWCRYQVDNDADIKRLKSISK